MKPPRAEILREPEQEPQQLRKFFIADRGEIAGRYLDVCVENGHGAVVAYYDPDRNAPHIQRAYELSLQYPGKYALAYLGGDRFTQTFGNDDAVILSAKSKGCTDFIPGYGLWAENAAKVKKVRDAGMNYVGASTEAILTLGQKHTSCERAEALGIKTLRISGLLQSPQHAVEVARQYAQLVPTGEKAEVIIKASRGGGGRGNMTRDVSDLAGIQEDANTTILRHKDAHMERALPNARHIEAQVMRDVFGNVIVDLRDCSVQIGDQKRIEMAPPQNLSEETATAIKANAALLFGEADYVGVGTAEFLLGADRIPYFIEVNTRIQVEHPVTEMRMDAVDPETGEKKPLNMLAVQIDLSLGKPLPEIIINDNVVVEARIVAENTDTFTAVHGVIDQMEIPDVKNTRADMGYRAGNVIPSDTDTMLGKFIVWGKTMEEATQTMYNKLNHTVITGPHTNIDFDLWMIGRPEFQNGQITTQSSKADWEAHRLDEARNIDSFFENGRFREYEAPFMWDTESPDFPDMAYEHRGQIIDHRVKVAKEQAEDPTHCAFRFGIYEESPQNGRPGEKIPVGYFDFKKNAGAFGPREALAMKSLYELTARDGYKAVLLILNSGGADQPTGVRALNAMTGFAKLYAQNEDDEGIITIAGYFSSCAGGANAALDGVAVRIADRNARFSLSGWAITAPLDGYKTAQDYPPDHHSPQLYAQHRQLELIAANPSHLMQMALEISSFVSDRAYTPPQTVGRFTAKGPIGQHGQTGPAVIRDIRESIHHNKVLQFLGGVAEAVPRYTRPRGAIQFHIDNPPYPTEELNNRERFQRLDEDANRMTFSDMLRSEYGIFDRVIPLSQTVVVGNVEFTPAIIGALAQIGRRKFLLLGHNTIRKVNPDGTVIKEYLAAGPEDHRWAARLIEHFAIGLGYHLATFSATKGALATHASNMGGINSELSRWYVLTHAKGIRTTSFNLDRVGSGGGLVFSGRTAAAFWLSDSVGEIAITKDAQVKILLGGDMNKEPTPQQVEAVIDQQKGTPRERKRLGEIDGIIPVPVGGPQNNPRGFGQVVRQVLAESYDKQDSLSPKEIRDLDDKLVWDTMMRGMKPTNSASKGETFRA